jgi:AraC-like DNA-binding protein
MNGGVRRTARIGVSDWISASIVVRGYPQIIRPSLTPTHRIPHAPFIPNPFPEIPRAMSEVYLPLRIPEVPPPWPGSMAERSGGKTARLWYAEGFWWFRGRHGGAVREISTLLRRTLYNVPELSRELDMPVRSFQRLVKDEVGCFAGHWLRSLRAAEMRLRLKTSIPIGQLSKDYGFSRATEFSKEFKRWHQVTPSAFRSRHAEATNRACHLP